MDVQLASHGEGENVGWGCWDGILAYQGRDNRVVEVVEETTRCVASWSALFTKYYSGDRIKKNEMGGARDT